MAFAKSIKFHQIPPVAILFQKKSFNSSKTLLAAASSVQLRKVDTTAKKARKVNDIASPTADRSAAAPVKRAKVHIPGKYGKPGKHANGRVKVDLVTEAQGGSETNTHEAPF